MSHPSEQPDNDEQQVMVIGPDGSPVGMARVPGNGSDESESGHSGGGVMDMVE
jgi:hypothetical protein